jgi:hypothetical protein
VQVSPSQGTRPKGRDVLTQTLPQIHRDSAPPRSWPDAASPALDERLDVDPFAGEDDLWADEDVLLEARVANQYDQDVVEFFRTLAVVLAVGLIAWIAVGAVALELYGLLAG